MCVSVRVSVCECVGVWPVSGGTYLGGHGRVAIFSYTGSRDMISLPLCKNLDKINLMIYSRGKESIYVPEQDPILYCTIVFFILYL